MAPEQVWTGAENHCTTCGNVSATSLRVDHLVIDHSSCLVPPGGGYCHVINWACLFCLFIYFIDIRGKLIVMSSVDR